MKIAVVAANGKAGKLIVEEAVWMSPPSLEEKIKLWRRRPL